MKLDDLVREARKFSRPYRITDGSKFRLADIDPGDTAGLGSEDKPQAKDLLVEGVNGLAQFQELLYAQDQWSLLLVFQAMDAAGKDGAIKHVMSGVNPQGCQVTSYKAPSDEELDHDFMWRCWRRLPERGRIGIFNRSYYEEVLVVRVHKEILGRQKLPRELVDDDIWKRRYRDIRKIERYLSENGTIVRKFFLHVSRDEQKRRFLERIDNPEKNWKFSAGDVRERSHWSAYMQAYEDAIAETATKSCPWYVVPADNKWFTRLVIAMAIIDALGSLELRFPEIGPARIDELQAAREILTAEDA